MRAAVGPSPWTVIGILLVAVSLVAVGAMVTLSSLNGTGPGVGRAPDPTPTPGAGRSTPIILTVGPRAAAETQDPGPTPSTGGAPGLVLPSSAGGPLFAPSAPPASGAATAPGGQQQPGAPTPAGGDAPPQTAADPTSETSPEASPASGVAAEPLPIPTAPGSPVTAQSPAARAAAEALAKLTTDEEKVGQLLLLAWIGGAAEEARPALRDLKAGGIVHVQNTTTMAGATAINQGLKQIARDAGLIAPLIAIDHEGGEVQRIRGCPKSREQLGLCGQRREGA